MESTGKMNQMSGSLNKAVIFENSTGIKTPEVFSMPEPKIEIHPKSTENFESEISDLNKLNEAATNKMNNLRKGLGLDKPTTEEPFSNKVNNSRIASLEQEKKKYVEKNNATEKETASKEAAPRKDIEGTKNDVRPATLISDVESLNKAGVEWEPLNIINESTMALSEMPKGRIGIVLGSGGNTGNWKSKGWKTLDINPNSGADLIYDANNIGEIVAPKSQDFLCVERVKFDPHGVEGVSPGRLLEQANKTLKMGGTLVIESAHFENNPDSTLPDRRAFADLMTKHGFDAVVEVGSINNYEENGESRASQNVVYYARKSAEGYDASRLKEKSSGVKYDTKTGLPFGASYAKKPNESKAPLEYKSELVEEYKINDEFVKSFETKDFYERLGVSRNASEEDINRAFKDLSKKYHPDLSGNNEILKNRSLKIQQLISEARSVLSTSTNRAKYDQKINEAISKEHLTQQNNEDSTAYGKNNYSGGSIDEWINSNSEFKNFTNLVQDYSWFENEIPKIKISLERLVKLGVDRKNIQHILEPKLMNNFYNHYQYMSHNKEGVKKMSGLMEAYESLGISREKLLNSLGQRNKDIFLEDAKRFFVRPFYDGL